MLKTRVYYGRCADPWLNLAFEEYLVDSLGEEDAILFLWQNRDTVVIGRNQNPWRECNLAAMAQDGVRLARRVTGGGAVFHDDGNLNFSFILPRKDADVTKQGRVILNAVSQLGLKAEQTGRNDLTVDGRKFSGNAFLNRRNASLHHGTILVGADMSRLSGYLTVSEDKLRGKGVQSVRSRVVNLAELSAGLTVGVMAGLVAGSFSDMYGKPGQVIETDLTNVPPEVEALRERNASREWLLGKTPEFTMTLRNRFSWGEVELGIHALHGIVQEAIVWSDGLEPELPSILGSVLKGLPFESEAMASAIGKASVAAEEEDAQETIRRRLIDIAGWIGLYPL